MGISPRTLRPSAFSPRSISGLALWLDASSSDLYTTDAGPVVAVNDPRDIGSLAVWLDASDSATLFQDASATTAASAASDPIGCWKDKSGNNRHYTGSSTTRPLLAIAKHNGKNSVYFDGSDDVLETVGMSNSSVMDATGACAWVVYESNNDTDYAVLGFSASAAGYERYSGGGCYHAYFRTDRFPALTPLPPASGLTLLTSSASVASDLQSLRINGATTITHPCATTFATWRALGSQAWRVGRDTGILNGWVSEVIVLGRSATATEVAQVEKYLAAKWSISGVHRSAAQEIAAVASPTEISGCAGWWDASRTDKMFNATTGGSLVADGGTVLRLEDLSGNGKHLIQATSGSAPSRQDGAKNGLPALNFAGTKSLAAGAAGDWNFLHNTNGGTVIAVIKPFDTADPQTFAYGVATNVGGASNSIGWSLFFDDRYPGYFRNNHVSHYVMAGVTGQSVLSQERDSAVSAANDFSLLSFTPFAGSSTTAGRAAMYVNGTATGNANSSALAPTASNSTHALTVGTAGANSIAGLAELIVFNTVLSAVDRARVEKYLQRKWSTPTVPDPTPPVGYWGDKSGNGRHLTQPLSVARPSLLPAGISSKPALNFDGTDDNIWRQPGLTSDDLSILIVHQTNTLSGGITYEFTHSGDITNSQATNTLGFGNVAGLQVSAGGVPTYMCDVTRSFTNIDLQGRSGSAGDISANVPVIGTHCVSYSETASAIRKQAWASGKGMLNSGRFNCGGWSAITLGARRNNMNAGGLNIPTVFLNGRIAEVIAYSRYISDADRRRLELYLARKWSVTLTGAPIVSNAEAQDWIDRVYGNGGSVSTATAQAVNTLCQSITDAGIRDRFYRMNIFAGSNLNAALTPLYLGPTPLGIRYGGTTDTNNAFVGVGTDYAETGASGGLTGNGTTKYLNTGFNVDQLPGAANCHLSSFITGTQDIASPRTLIGTLFNGVADRYRIFLNNTTAGIYLLFTELGVSYQASATRANANGGLMLASRTSTTLLTLYDDAVSVGTNETSTAAVTGASPFFVFARNGPTEYYNGRMAAYSIGAGMTDAQVTAYNTAIQAFQTAMGRV